MRHTRPNLALVLAVAGSGVDPKSEAEAAVDHFRYALMGNAGADVIRRAAKRASGFGAQSDAGRSSG